MRCTICHFRGHSHCVSDWCHCPVWNYLVCSLDFCCKLAFERVYQVLVKIRGFLVCSSFITVQRSEWRTKIKSAVNPKISAVSMWYSYIFSIDIDRYFSKYLNIDRYRYRYTCHCSWTEWCEVPVQRLPIPLPAINCLQKSVYFRLKCCFSLTVNTNLPYGKQ